MKRSPDNGNGLTERSRLDSWKAIAAYLNRDVRTAHRWERNEGLPVHRHQHSSRGTVYAYASEIDDWLGSRSQRGNSRRSGSRRARLFGLYAAGGAAAGIVVLATATVWIRPPVAASSDAIGLLVPLSENLSGEQQFDTTVDDYLRGELSGSPRVQVLSPTQIRNRLMLMRENPDRPLDRSLAAELARRTPEVDLILASKLERFGSGYVLTAELTDPAEGAVLGNVRSEASSEDELMAALRNLAGRTVDAIDSIELPERPWHIGRDPVTTSSAAAADLYDEATLLMYNATWQLPAAEAGLRRAVELDPEFASAYIQLAYAIMEQGRPASDYLPFAERASELAETASEPERLFILGSYDKLHGDLTSALPKLFALTETYPGHFWGQFQMAELSHARDNLQGAAWSMALAADLRPQALEFQMTAFNFILTTPHLWNAARIRERLNELNPPGNNGGVHPFLPAEFFEVNLHFLDGDAEAAFDELNAMRRKLDAFPDDVWTKRSGYAARLAEAYLALGRMHDAEALLEIVLDDDADVPRNTPAIRMADEQRLQLLLAVSRNQPCCDMSPTNSFRILDTLILDTASGAIDAGDDVVIDILRRNPPQARILRAELARQAGDADRAIELLSAALSDEDERLRELGLAPGLATATTREYLLAAGSLADLLIGAGESDAAMRVLARWSNDQSRAAAFMSSPAFAPYWTDLRWRLARLYLDNGRPEAASVILDYLSRLLALADDDHYVASQLR